MMKADGGEDQASPAEPMPPFEGSADDPAVLARSVLYDVHLAKSEADGERYFSHFAKDAVFLGTDRSERMSLVRWRALVGPYFARGQGATSFPIEQFVYLSPDQNMAWFEERLERQLVGQMRGTGVLRKVGATWKLAHYNLVLLVPRELADDLAERIHAFYGY